MPLFRLGIARPPDLIADPSSRPVFLTLPGLLGIHDVDSEGRIAGDAARLAFEPEIPPAKRLLKEPDARLRHREMRIFMHPRPDDCLARAPQAPHEPRDGIGISVVPAADAQAGSFNPAKILADAPVLPIGIAMGVLHPRRHQEGLVLEPLHPYLLPALTENGRVGRPR